MPILAGGTIAPGPGDVVYEEVTFTETAGAGTYTGSVTVPAGAWLVDVIVHAVAVWDTTTSATMIVGNVADDNGIYTGIDLKANDLLAGESICLAAAGGKQGADLADFATPGSQFSRRYLSTARVISGIIVTVGAAGSAGRTRMVVAYTVGGSTPATKA